VPEYSRDAARIGSFQSILPAQRFERRSADCNAEEFPSFMCDPASAVPAVRIQRRRENELIRAHAGDVRRYSLGTASSANAAALASAIMTTAFACAAGVNGLLMITIVLIVPGSTGAQ
jgi:hypothetical protein